MKKVADFLRSALGLNKPAARPVSIPTVGAKFISPQAIAQRQKLVAAEMKKYQEKEINKRARAVISRERENDRIRESFAKGLAPWRSEGHER